ncbi:MAG: hypothetical protein JKY37_16340, partial [Nannocystaceae bacterium]|nr:hypothetical protein [Nannocystaceae bacterium]
GWLDRCDTEGDQCLRWCQVVARNGDRFVAGYLPAYLVTRQDSWVRGAAALPRAQLIRSGTRNKSAQLLLIARDRHGTLHRKRIAVPLRAGQFPTTTPRVEGDWALIGVGETEPLKIALDDSMDVRHR